MLQVPHGIFLILIILKGIVMYIYCDCEAGISGDMFLGALCHLGLDLAPLQKLLADVGIECELKTWQECRAAGPGHRVDVAWPSEQPLRHPKDIADIFTAVNVSPAVREKALAILDALTQAEAHAHAIPPEQVHFHEVGAIDTVVDILGAVWGLEQLGIQAVLSSALPWFTGTVECEHGLLPLPAPATAFLLAEKPVCHTWSQHEWLSKSELVTPTGAALIHVLAQSFTTPPSGQRLRLGTGYGSRKAPVGLRLWLMQNDAQKGPHNAYTFENISQLESHIDHLTGEELGACLTALSEHPHVLDVLWLPGLGKKNRPSGLLRVLCLPSHKNAVEAVFYTHTHTLGIRHCELERSILSRKAGNLNAAEISLQGASFPAKEYELDGQTWLRPECDALKEQAQERNLGIPALRMYVKSTT